MIDSEKRLNVHQVKKEKEGQPVPAEIFFGAVTEGEDLHKELTTNQDDYYRDWEDQELFRYTGSFLSFFVDRDLRELSRDELDDTCAIFARDIYEKAIIEARKRLDIPEIKFTYEDIFKNFRDQFLLRYYHILKENGFSEETYIRQIYGSGLPSYVISMIAKKVYYLRVIFEAYCGEKKKESPERSLLLKDFSHSILDLDDARLSYFSIRRDKSTSYPERDFSDVQPDPAESNFVSLILKKDGDLLFPFYSPLFEAIRRYDFLGKIIKNLSDKLDLLQLQRLHAHLLYRVLRTFYNFHKTEILRIDEEQREKILQFFNLYENNFPNNALFVDVID